EYLHRVEVPDLPDVEGQTRGRRLRGVHARGVGGDRPQPARQVAGEAPRRVPLGAWGHAGLRGRARRGAGAGARDELTSLTENPPPYAKLLAVLADNTRLELPPPTVVQKASGQ